MRDLASDLRHLSINTATLRKQLPLPDILEACATRGIGAVCPWRDQVHAAGLAAVARQITANTHTRIRFFMIASLEPELRTTNNRTADY